MTMRNQSASPWCGLLVEGDSTVKILACHQLFLSFPGSAWEHTFSKLRFVRLTQQCFKILLSGRYDIGTPQLFAWVSFPGSAWEHTFSKLRFVRLTQRCFEILLSGRYDIGTPQLFASLFVSAFRVAERLAHALTGQERQRQRLPRRWCVNPAG